MTSSRRSLLILLTILFAALTVAPAVVFGYWTTTLPEATTETAPALFGHAWKMLVLFGVVGALEIFLAEYALRRGHRWART